MLVPKVLKIARRLGVFAKKKVVNAMKNALSLLMIAGFSLAVLLAGCGNSEQAEGELESSSSVPVETSLKTVSSADPEASESQPDGLASEQPQEPVPSSAPASEPQTTDSETMEENRVMNMIVQAGGSTFAATLEENAAVDALVKMMEQGPVTIQMRDYSGFEKVGSLEASLPASNQQTTTQAGDIVLYQGYQIVMFYGSNSWSYTRLGHIGDLTGWEEALGGGDVTVTFSLEN